MAAQLQAALSELAVAMKTDLTAARSNLLTKNMFGLQKTYTPGTASAWTFCNTMEMETDFVGVQIGIHNIHTAAIPNVRVSVAVGDNFSNGTGANWLNDPTPTNGTGWHDCTFNGATTGTLAARVAANVSSITWFDFTGIQSILRAGGMNGTLRPILAVKIEFPSGAVLTVPYNDIYGWRTDGLVHRPLRVSSQAVAGVTTPSAFTTTSSVDTNVVVPVVRYLTKKAGRQVMMAGDSTTEGTGGECRAMGATQIACLGLSTPNDPVEYFNCGMHGTSPNDFGVGALTHLPVVKPHVFFYQPYSINNTPAGGLTQGVLETDYTYLGRVIQAALAINTKMYLFQGLPCNPAFRNTGAGDSKRRDLNTLLASMTQVKVVVDYTLPMTGAVDANGQTNLPSGVSDDDAHPNTATYTLMAAKVSPYIAAA